MLELYHDWRSFCSIKVRLCLAEKELDWTSRHIDLMALEHTTPEYLKINPNGVVPTLVHNGIPIHESTLINEYLEEVFPDIRLMPEDPIERARARFWVKYEDDVLHPSIRPATFALMMSPELAQRTDDELEEMVAAHPNKQRAEELRRAARMPIDNERVDAARRSMIIALDRLERRLSEQRRLVYVLDGGPAEGEENRIWLLTPIPEPSTAVSLSLGLALLALRRHSGSRSRSTKRTGTATRP